MVMMMNCGSTTCRRPRPHHLVRCVSGGGTGQQHQHQHHRVMLSWSVAGRVGARVSSFVVTEPRPQTILVRCVNNQGFYAYLYLASMLACGAVPPAAARKEKFLVQHSPEHRSIGVTSKSDPKFWLTLRYRHDVLCDE